MSWEERMGVVEAGIYHDDAYAGTSGPGLLYSRRVQEPGDVNRNIEVPIVYVWRSRRNCTRTASRSK